MLYTMENQVESAVTEQPNGEAQGQATTERQEGVGATEAQSHAKTFTEEQLNAMFSERAKRASESAIKGLLSSFGVGSVEELGTLVAAGRKEPEYLRSLEDQADGKRKLAFALNGISDALQEEIDFYFKGKGIELNDENLKKELETHPHWKGTAPQAPTQQQPTQAPQAETQRQSGVSISVVGSAPQQGDAEYNKRRERFLRAGGISPTRK